MPSSFESFTEADPIEATQVSEMHEPIQNLERGAAFYAVTSGDSSTAYTVTLDPTPDVPHQSGMLLNFKVNVQNEAGLPDVTLSVNGATAKPILKNGGQSLAAGDLKAEQIVSLIFDADTQAFQLLAIGGSSINSLDDLSDVNISSPASGQVIRHNGTDFVNATIAASDLPTGIDAAKISGGSVSNAEFNYLEGVTSSIQDQLDAMGGGGGSLIALADGGTGLDNSGQNVGLGAGVFGNATSVTEFTAVGHHAGLSAVSNYDCTFLGHNAGSNATSNHNTFLGSSSGYSAATSQLCTLVGSQCGYGITSGNGITALGYNAFGGSNPKTGNNQTAIGNSAMYSASTATSNVGVGTEVLYTNETGINNVAIGFRSLTAATAYGNTAVGCQTGYLTTSGYQNSLLGSQSGYNNTTGNNNTLFGFNSGESLTSGSNNIAIGASVDVADGEADDQINIGNAFLRAAVTQAVSMRAGAVAYENSADTVVLDLTDRSGWLHFVDSEGSMCRAFVTDSAVTIEASSADWVASSTPASGEVGLYVSSSSLHLVLGGAAARFIGFIDQLIQF